ncbi:MAG: insulinase family protein [Sandaracinaceae bacterium]
MRLPRPLRSLPRSVLAATVLTVSCGAPPLARAPSLDDPERAGGVELTVLPRPSGDRVFVDLWIDAGSLDAPGPGVAAVAAWFLAARSGAEGRATADGIELRFGGARAQLVPGLERLATALASRLATEEELAPHRARLEGSRRRVLASLTRQADALALSALLGQPVDPLGQPGDPLPTPDQVSTFLAAHVGRGRVRLIVVGDLDPGEVRAVVEAAFGDLPAPRRAERPARPVPSPGARGLAWGQGDAVSLALVEPSWPAALALARRLTATLDARYGIAAASEVFPLDGRMTVLIRTTDGPAAAAGQALAREAQLLRRLPVAPEGAPTTGGGFDDPRDEAAWIGARWASERALAARGARAGGRAPAALGMVLADGRGDDLDAAEPGLDALQRAAGERPFELLEPHDGPAHPTPGEWSRRENGALVRVEATGGPGAAASVRFRGRTGLGTAPGTRALWLRAVIDACHDVARRELGTTLAARGIEVRPVLEPDAGGLDLAGPPVEMAHLAIRCASAPLSGHLERARSEALPGAAAPEGRLAARIARVLSPDDPERVDPSPALAGLAALEADDLDRVRAGLVVGRRTTLVLAGSRIPADAVDHAVQLVEGLPAGSAPSAPEPWPAADAEPLRSGEASGPRPELIVAWRAEDAPALSARVLAGVARAALLRTPRTAPAVTLHGARDGAAFVGLGALATDEALAAVPRALDAVRRAVASSGPELARRSLLAMAEAEAWRRAASAGRASHLADEGPDPPPGPTLAQVVSGLRRLADQTPLVVVARPRAQR